MLNTRKCKVTRISEIRFNTSCWTNDFFSILIIEIYVY